MHLKYNTHIYIFITLLHYTITLKFLYIHIQYPKAIFHLYIHLYQAFNMIIIKVLYSQSQTQSWLIISYYSFFTTFTNHLDNKLTNSLKSLQILRNNLI